MTTAKITIVLGEAEAEELCRYARTQILPVDANAYRAHLLPHTGIVLTDACIIDVTHSNAYSPTWQVLGILVEIEYLLRPKYETV